MEKNEAKGVNTFGKNGKTGQRTTTFPMLALQSIPELWVIQMVDDVVKMVYEEDCFENVILISLKYDLIDYVEKNYPEFRTSALLFSGIGDFTKLHCDLLGIEEGLGHELLYWQAHTNGKRISVWTPNTEEALRRFLDSNADCVTTDQVELTEKVRKELAQRTTREVIQERVLAMLK